MGVTKGREENNKIINEKKSARYKRIDGTLLDILSFTIRVARITLKVYLSIFSGEFPNVEADY